MEAVSNALLVHISSLECTHSSSPNIKIGFIFLTMNSIGLWKLLIGNKSSKNHAARREKLVDARTTVSYCLGEVYEPLPCPWRPSL